MPQEGCADQLAGGGGNGLGLAHADGQPAIEGAEGGLAAAEAGTAAVRVWSAASMVATLVTRQATSQSARRSRSAVNVRKD